MPEGPDLFITSRFINRVCNGRIFGKIHKSEISKNLVVIPPAEKFCISATSRGKEIKMVLSEPILPSHKKSGRTKTKPFKPLSIMFTFGMAGKFEFYEATELMKHAHLNFYTADQQKPMVLSFVDYRRFGRWRPGADFSYSDRGPCVLTEYNLFRDNVLQHLSSPAFNRPICEALVNQKFFNGIGNYLRAEILYRLKIPPFVSARSVLEPLAEKDKDGVSVKSKEPDILQLCNRVPLEVTQLENSWYDGANRKDAANSICNWLRCYNKDGMKNIADHYKRTIWYSGDLGPMAPKDGVTRKKLTWNTEDKKGGNSTTKSKVEGGKKAKPKKRTNTNKDDIKTEPKKKKKKVQEISNDMKTEGVQSPESPGPKRLSRSRVKKS